MFHQVTADQLLFSGYNSGALDFFLEIFSDLGLPLPDMLAGGKFGLWYGRNGTMKDQYYNINTGARYIVSPKNGAMLFSSFETSHHFLGHPV